MNVVIYARFSSHSQTEQSIEGQLKVCYEYAEQNHYTVVGEYIDRAMSGKYDNRAEFQRMISDSDKQTFEGVLVYQLKKAIREADTAIENLWRGIEQGQSVPMLTERLNKRQAEKEALEEQLAVEENKRICLSEAQVFAFLDYVSDMPLDDVNKRRAVINILVHSVYLYDDHFTLIINASKKQMGIENIPLEEIEEAFNTDKICTEQCSTITSSPPP